MIYQITLEAFHDSSALTFIRIVSGSSKNLLCTMSFFFSFEHISSAHFNKFSAFGFAGISTIPPSITGCCSLAEFYMGLLSHPLIKITFEFSSIGSTNVTSLILIWHLEPPIFRNNALSTLPAEIGALSRLGTLDLHSNQVAS